MPRQDRDRSGSYNAPEYKRNRVVVLDGNPPCHLCGRPGADTVDHIVPVIAGGDNGLENLRPAHRSCNSRAGNRYRQQQDHQRVAARAEAMRDAGRPISESHFLRPTGSPPPQLAYLSEGDQPEPAGKGHDQPRLQTVVVDRERSRAGEVGGWAKRHLGVDLMPWQLYALQGLLAIDADEKFVHRTGLISTARQNGKTTALTALVGWYLTEEAVRRGPVTVLTTAHRLDVATELFHRLADLLEERFGAKVMRAYGRNEVRMLDGSRWLIKAASPSVGHGLSCDLIVADEIWDITGTAIDQGLLPTMRARPNPLMAMWSTAGTEASDVFRRYREQGLRAIDQATAGRFYFAEWSPPPDMNPMTPAAWEYANPALGHTLEAETLAAEAESPDRAAFLRSSVNLWIATDRGWLAPGTWSALEHGGNLPSGGTVAIESSMLENAYFGVRAVQLPDGNIVTTVAFHVDTTHELLDAIAECAEDHSLRLAISPSIDVHFPPHLQHRRKVVGYGELSNWTTPVRGLIMEGRVRHTGETMLAEHVNRAVMVKVPNGHALSSQKSPGPIELARCMVWAVALEARPVNTGKPMIVTASR